MYSGDFQYILSRLQLRGVVAHGFNSHAENLAAGVGEEIFGWYVEGGVEVLPDAWKQGRLKLAELIPFVRYERYDTQHRLPGGATATGANDRTDVTVGANLLLTPRFVVKADVQFLRNELAGWDVDNKYNLGIGWVFE